jgi:hypothetical protein
MDKKSQRSVEFLKAGVGLFDKFDPAQNFTGPMMDSDGFKNKS